MVRGVRIKDHWGEQRIFDQRAVIAGAVIAALILLLVGRLFVLQVQRYDYYAELSQGNRVRMEPIPATRGLILDRKGLVLADNQPAFQLELVPEEVPDLEKSLKGLVELGLLAPDDLPSLRRMVKSRRSFESVPLRLRMSEEDVAKFSVRRFEFPGVDIKTRQTRRYPHTELAVHALGYVAAISETDLQRIDRGAYSGTTLIGKLGVESAYERELHGVNGFREILVNAQGRSVQRQGAFVPNLRTEAPLSGDDLMLSLDFDVQRIAEEGLGDRRGAVVAIDPRNGDVITLVSRPGFDPNLFGRGLTYAEYDSLQNNMDRPLLNRALRGMYPPGSTVKPVIALAGLAYHLVDPGKYEFCGGVFRLPRSSHQFREGRSGRHGNVNLEDAIAKSCDVYFYQLATVIGVDRIAEFLKPFGFGQNTGIDISGEKPGLLPSREWKRKAFSRPQDQVWFPGETVNFGIGQGYMLVTPLQLAHITSVIASRGKVFKPRLVTGVRDARTGAVRTFTPEPEPDIKLSTAEEWLIVVNGMIGATTRGTAAAVSRTAPYTLAGKTGTAQVFTVAQNARYDAKTVQERLRDHSWFIAFAPADNPRIAVAVLVENGGFGASAAAPIARRVLDTYLLGPAAAAELAPKLPIPAPVRAPVVAPIAPATQAPAVPASTPPSATPPATSPPN